MPIHDGPGAVSDGTLKHKIREILPILDTGDSMNTEKHRDLGIDIVIMILRQLSFRVISLTISKACRIPLLLPKAVALLLPCAVATMELLFTVITFEFRLLPKLLPKLLPRLLPTLLLLLVPCISEKSDNYYEIRNEKRENMKSGMKSLTL
jgi:hypothetical protein